jgi:hypothetical protein
MRAIPLHDDRVAARAVVIFRAIHDWSWLALMDTEHQVAIATSTILMASREPPG